MPIKRVVLWVLYILQGKGTSMSISFLQIWNFNFFDASRRSGQWWYLRSVTDLCRQNPIMRFHRTRVLFGYKYGIESFALRPFLLGPIIPQNRIPMALLRMHIIQPWTRPFREWLSATHLNPTHLGAPPFIWKCTIFQAAWIRRRGV